MNDVFKILNILHDKKITFCFNFNARQEYYNLKVLDTYGEEHYLVDDNLADIEKKLKVIWGHLLKETKAMPLPPGV